MIFRTISSIEGRIYTGNNGKSVYCVQTPEIFSFHLDSIKVIEIHSFVVLNQAVFVFGRVRGQMIAEFWFNGLEISQKMLISLCRSSKLWRNYFDIKNVK